jgi:hypothetical protein
MRYLLAIAASICMLSLSSAATKGILPLGGATATSATASAQIHLTSYTPRYMSLGAKKARKMEHIIARNAPAERWWMLFVGTTLIAYRLFRKHQVLFEASFLSLAPDVPRPENVTLAVKRAISRHARAAVEA